MEDAAGSPAEGHNSLVKDQGPFPEEGAFEALKRRYLSKNASWINDTFNLNFTDLQTNNMSSNSHNLSSNYHNVSSSFHNVSNLNTGPVVTSTGPMPLDKIQLIKAIVLVVVIAILLLSTCKLVFRTFSKYAGKREDGP